MQLEISRKKLDPSSLCVRERKKRDTRDSGRERERERERERGVDLWEDRQLEVSERGRERVHRELCGSV